MVITRICIRWKGNPSPLEIHDIGEEYRADFIVYPDNIKKGKFVVGKLVGIDVNDHCIRYTVAFENGIIYEIVPMHRVSRVAYIEGKGD